jgi:hypothetical protein
MCSYDRKLSLLLFLSETSFYLVVVLQMWADIESFLRSENIDGAPNLPSAQAAAAEIRNAMEQQRDLVTPPISIQLLTTSLQNENDIDGGMPAPASALLYDNAFTPIFNIDEIQQQRHQHHPQTPVQYPCHVYTTSEMDTTPHTHGVQQHHHHRPTVAAHHATIMGHAQRLVSCMFTRSTVARIILRCPTHLH